MISDNIKKKIIQKEKSSRLLQSSLYSSMRGFLSPSLFQRYKFGQAQTEMQVLLEKYQVSYGLAGLLTRTFLQQHLFFLALPLYNRGELTISLWTISHIRVMNYQHIWD